MRRAHAARTPGRSRYAFDASLLVVLFGATLAYVAALPPNLGGMDESAYLYESKLLLQGRVLYRDVFELLAPGWFYLMAGTFRLFGASVGIARVVNATVHGLIVATIYGACRVLGVRRAIAAAVALVHVAILQPAWPYASPHWLSTWLSLVLLVVLLARPRAWPLAAGVVAGLLVVVQQQKGAIFTASAGALLLIDAVLGRRRAARPLPFLAFAGGVLLVTVPIAVVVLTAAGVDPVVHALVRQPLENYRSFNRTTWGSVDILTFNLARYTFPPLLRWAPLSIPLVLGVLAAGGREALRAGRNVVLLAGFALVSIVSILYFPDFIHVSFVAPAFLILFAVLADRLVERLPAGGARVAGGLVAAGLLVASGVQIDRNWSRVHADFPVEAPTAFGTVAFRNREELALVERLRRLADESGSRVFFFYPGYPSLNLMSDTENPTRYMLLMPVYSRAEQLQEAIDVLETRKIAYVGIVPLLVKPGDPVVAYVTANYERLDEPEMDRVTHVTVYRRRQNS